MNSEDPILIVGARTTGLTMACGLARAGVRVRIIDACEGIDPHCRANLLHSRSLEILHDLGLVEEFERASLRVTAMAQFVDGRLALHHDLGEVDSPFPWSLAQSQAETEAILERGLSRFGVEVERSTELTDLVQHETHVHATLRHSDGREETTDTPWLLGCDGAHSLVRRLNREGFPGEADPRHYLIADVVAEGGGIPRGEATSYLSDAGVLFFFPLPDGRNLVACDLRGGAPPTSEVPTLDELQALVTERGPANTVVRDPRWNTYFRIHYRLAEHYRHGRAFLAGDAAHIHSPIGGYGMNTGIQDAYNLSWKLAVVMHGRTRDPERLLDSYPMERRAVARDLLQATRAITETLFEFGHLSKEEQQRLQASMIVPEPDRLREGDHRETLDLDYRKSPICTDDVPPDFRSGIHAGSQAPDAGPLEENGVSRSLFEVLRGPQHVLLVFPGPETCSPRAAWRRLQKIVEPYRGWIDVCVVTSRQAPDANATGVRTVVDLEGALARRYDVLEPSYYLIRPDGHVGYRSIPASVEGLQGYLDRTY